MATIRPSGPGEAERSFRYAPLSSELDIVRKTLGQHEIATILSKKVQRDELLKEEALARRPSSPGRRNRTAI